MCVGWKVLDIKDDKRKICLQSFFNLSSTSSQVCQWCPGQGKTKGSVSGTIYLLDPIGCNLRVSSPLLNQPIINGYLPTDTSTVKESFELCIKKKSGTSWLSASLHQLESAGPLPAKNLEVTCPSSSLSWWNYHLDGLQATSVFSHKMNSPTGSQNTK